MHYLLSTLHVYSILLDAVSEDFSELFLLQLVEPLQQPASAAACRRVLEPDILDVSSV
jgi:hypothetical protein